MPYAAAVLSVPILRITKSEVQRPFAVPFKYVFTAIGFILATYLIYWASWPWTLVGCLLLLTGYPAFLFVKEKKKDWGRSLWVFVYLLGIVVISFLGDSRFCFNNFTPWTPKNYLPMPYDIVVLIAYFY